MKQIYIRPAQPEDAVLFLEWQKLNTNFDPSAVVSDTSFTLVAFDDEGVVGFMPCAKPAVNPICLESLCFKPGISNLETVNAVKELFKGMILIGFMGKTDEVYFFGDHDGTAEFAEKHKFEKIPWDVYRLRLSNLEGTN
jgi:hypothetical protein